MSLRESLITFESQMVGLTLLQDQETEDKRLYKIGMRRTRARCVNEIFWRVDHDVIREQHPWSPEALQSWVKINCEHHMHV